MEYLILVACVLAGGILLLLFGQHRNKFKIIVSRVIETYSEDGILIEGKIASGWIAVSQGLFLKKHEKSHYFTVTVIEENGSITSRSKSSDMLKLILSGSKINLIEEGSILTTSKTKS